MHCGLYRGQEVEEVEGRRKAEAKLHETEESLALREELCHQEREMLMKELEDLRPRMDGLTLESTRSHQVRNLDV